MKRTEDFLIEHKLRAIDIDIENLVEVFTEEMEKGLRGLESSLRMIPTYIEAENEFLKDTPVIAIDAGGTNFRVSLVKFTSSGKLEMSPVSNFNMPGIDREVSRQEFFRAITNYIGNLSDKSDRIGFCFSYPTEIFPDKDGRLIQFCKEVQAPGVVGQLIGKSILEAMGTPDKKIVLLNDTVATLLAGKSASFGKSYDSFIGYILGTGTNTCYIESNHNILKNRSLDQNRSQIINIESGNFGKAQRTDLDLLFDSTTMNPGNYSFEKMFSGGYFGGLCLTVLKAAAGEGLLSGDTAYRLSQVKDLPTVEASSFLSSQGSRDGWLSECFAQENDRLSALLIIDTLIDRASRLVAANLAAVVLKTGRGISPEKPVLITIDGTAFYKLHNLKPRFEKYFAEFLSGGRKRYTEFTFVEQSGIIGAALAGLID
jgi:hexokinase